MLLQWREPVTSMPANPTLKTHFSPSPFKGPTTMRMALRENKGSLTSDIGIGILDLIIHMRPGRNTPRTDLR